MIPEVGNVIVDYVLAPDVERAAWQAWSYPANATVNSKM